MMDGALQQMLFQAMPAVVGLMEVGTTETGEAMTVVEATMGVEEMEVVMVEAAVEMVAAEAENEFTSMTSQSICKTVM